MEYRSDLAYEAEPRAEKDYEMRPMDDFVSYVSEYARARPEIFALTCFGIGFVLGWKLKPW